MSCSFQNMWLHSFTWLRKCQNNQQAFCTQCKKTFSVKSMGISAIKSHEKSARHVAIAKSISSNLHLKINIQPSQTEVVNLDNNEESVLDPNTETVDASKPHRTPAIANGGDILRAEILWAVKCIVSHYSYNSCSDVGALFKRAFPDSDIANKFSCGENKAAYLTCFGIGPYCQDQLKTIIQTAEHFVIMFDESYNDSLQKKQVDIHVRFWDNGKNSVESRYLTSEFIGHGKAEDVLKVLLDSIKGMGLNTNNLIQLSMDGPSVNWKLFRLLNTELEKLHKTTLLNIGSCGLHTVHNAFKNAAEKSDIEVGHVLKSLYWVFKDTPARREDFQKITGSGLFPLKFCGHRWLENKPVANRAIEIWPNIVKYVQTVKGDKTREPTSKSYEIIQKAASDPLMLTKLAFFQVVANQMGDFLQIFQSNRPMAPLLCSYLEVMIKQLMKRFIKSSVLKTATNMQNLLKIDVTKTDHHVSLKDVDLGFKAESEIKKLFSEKKITERDIVDCRMKCKTMLKLSVEHLITKTPISFAFARGMGFLHPKRIIIVPDLVRTQLKYVLQTLISHKRIDEATADEIKLEYDDFVDFVSSLSSEEKFKFEHYDPLTSEPLDEFLLKHLGSFNKLEKLVKMLLILSHGQAGVERGFSFNKEILTENMRELSLINKRLIIDHIDSLGGINKFEITNQVLVYASSARQKYRQHLEDEKTKSTKTSASVKRKSLGDELTNLKKRRIEVEKDIKTLTKSADEKAESAEKSREIKKLIVESNALRKGAKDKVAELSEIDEKIKNISSQINNV